MTICAPKGPERWEGGDQTTTFHSLQKKSFWPHSIMMTQHGACPILYHWMWLGIYQASKSNIPNWDWLLKQAKGWFFRAWCCSLSLPSTWHSGWPPTSAVTGAQPGWISSLQQPFSFTFLFGFIFTFMFIYCSVEIGTALWQLVWLYCPGGKTNKLWVIHFWTSIWSWAFEPWSIPGLPGAAWC